MRISVTVTATATSIITTADRDRISNPVTRRRPAAARLAMIAGALLAGAAILPNSLAIALGDHPSVAARVAPSNATVSADFAAALQNPQSGLARNLVRKSLGRDATNITAIELRALDLAQSGRRTEAARLFALSDRLSRRSLPTRLWLIQQSVDRGDAQAALANFDIALRTSTDAPAILFPVLARAAADPAIAASLARTLDRPSDWRLVFLGWALANGSNLHAIADVVIRMRDRAFLAVNEIDQRLIEQLVIGGDFGQALRLHRRFDSPAAGMIADGHFGDPGARYPFGWGLVTDGTVRAERSLSGNRSMLSYRGGMVGGGQLAAQLLFLSPGRYRLATTTAEPANGDPPYWQLSCANPDGALLAKLDQPAVAGGKASTGFAVSAGCSAQWLTLQLRPGMNSVPPSGAIASVSVIRS